jgi:HEAT repeat protein
MFLHFKIRRLIHRIRTAWPSDRLEAMRELVAIGAPAIPVLFKELDKKRGGAHIWEVLEQMDQNTVPVLIDALQSSKTRVYAIQLLNGNDPRALDALIPWTRDQDEKIRSAAAAAIGRGGNERVTEILLSFLSSADDALRYPAISALAGRDEPRVLDALLRMLSDPSSSRNRNYAAHALIGFRRLNPNPEVIAALIARLGDSDASVQSSVVEFLRKQQEPMAAGPLAKLVDKHDTLSENALFALEKILRSSVLARVPSDDLVAITHLKEWVVREGYYPDERSNEIEMRDVDKVKTVVALAGYELKRRGLQA